MLVIVHPHALIARDAGEVADEAGLAHTGVSLQQKGVGREGDHAGDVKQVLLFFLKI